MIAKKNAQLEIGGKKRTFWFGVGFMRLLFSNTGITMDNLSEQVTSNPFKVLPEMLFYSLKYGYDRVEADLDFTIYDVQEWIDDAGGFDSELVTGFMNELNKQYANTDGKKQEPKPTKREVTTGKKKGASTKK